MRTDAPRPRRAPVFSLPPCTAHSLFSQKREWGVHWTSPQRAADHPARQREYRPPLRQRSAPPPRPSGRAPAPLSGGKRKPPQASRLRANTNPRYHLNFPCGTLVSPLTAGPPSRPTLRSAAPLRDDFPRRLGDALTIRVLSWPRQAGYCFPSLRFYRGQYTTPRPALSRQA